MVGGGLDSCNLTTTCSVVNSLFCSLVYALVVICCSKGITATKFTVKGVIRGKVVCFAICRGDHMIYSGKSFWFLEFRTLPRK